MSKPLLTRVGAVPGREVILPEVVTAQGTLNSQKVTYVQSAIDGRIKRIAVHKDQLISKGDPIVYIDTTQLQNEKNIVLAQRNRINIAIEAQRQVVEKATVLYKKKVETLSSLQAETVKLNSIVAERKVVDAQLEKVDYGLENTVVRAPFSGKIQEMKVTAGSIVAAGSPVALLINTKYLKAELQFSQSLRNKIKPGMTVRLRLVHNNAMKITGKITKILPIINPETLTFTAVVNITTDGVWNPGAGIRAYVIIKDKRPVILVPPSALLYDNGLPYVFKLERKANYHAVAKRVKVKIGSLYYDKVQVVSGLKDGDLIVVHGNDQIVNNQSVLYIKEEN